VKSWVMTSRHLFCFGLGYSARALARHLRAQGWRVSGTVRDPAAIDALAREGIEAHVFPLESPAAALAGVSDVLSSVPPGEGGDPVLTAHGDALAALSGQWRWIGYLSTTGVYGNRDGGWVDESGALEPTGVRGARRVEAEAAWRALPVPAHVFRLAGIYGPGRNALVSVLEGSAKRIDKPGQVFSRIHVDDIAQILTASLARPDPGRIYNVCDDDPAPPEAVIAYAAQLLDRPVPPLVPLAQAGLSAMGLSFYADNKRVSNRRIKNELGISLRYPSYRDGLTALLPHHQSR